MERILAIRRRIGGINYSKKTISVDLFLGGTPDSTAQDLGRPPDGRSSTALLASAVGKCLSHQNLTSVPHSGTKSFCPPARNSESSLDPSARKIERPDQPFGRAFHPPEGREHEVRVLYPRQGPAIRALMAVMDRHRDDIWNFFGVPTSNPDFTREPVLEPIPSHEAAFLLLKERKQRTVSLDGSPLEPGAFLAHLNGLLAGVPCHRLTAGPRDKRLSLVLQCLGKG